MSSTVGFGGRSSQRRLLLVLMRWFICHDNREDFDNFNAPDVESLLNVLRLTDEEKRKFLETFNPPIGDIQPVLFTVE